MGILDKLPGNQSESDKNSSSNKTEPNDEKDEIEVAIAGRERNLNLADCQKFSFSDIAALGTNFAQMLKPLQTITTTTTVDRMAYIPVNNNYDEALRIASKKQPELFVGSFVDKKTGKRVFAKFKKAEPQTISMAATIPINPAMMMIAGMLVQIEKKIDKIQQTADNIMSFLQMDKQSEQQGNINVLNDSLQNYKYNWDNQQYLQNHHMKALDIKQKAEQNIIFYQK